MRYVIGLSFAALAVWILQATGILMGFLMFLMIGSVPGTHVSVPPTYMLVLLGLLMLATLYWLLRQRPGQQIQQMRRAYHEQVATEPQTAKHTTQKAAPLFRAGFAKSYSQTRRSAQQSKDRSFARARRSTTDLTARIARMTSPLRMAIVAFGAIVIIASHELRTWLRPHLKRIAAWTRKQIVYSVKGTMLSAHKWSSLSRKALSSLTSLLRRCSSVLKRGKSLLIRSAR